MHLDKGQGAGFKGIMDGNGCMGIGGGINNNAIKFRGGRLNFSDQIAFQIRLKTGAFHAECGGGFPAVIFQIVQRLCAVYFRLARAQHIQVGAIQDKDVISQFMPVIC